VKEKFSDIFRNLLVYSKKKKKEIRKGTKCYVYIKICFLAEKIVNGPDQIIDCRSEWLIISNEFSVT